jgi:hypothetical protein
MAYRFLEVVITIMLLFYTLTVFVDVEISGLMVLDVSIYQS